MIRALTALIAAVVRVVALLLAVSLIMGGAALWHDGNTYTAAVFFALGGLSGMVAVRGVRRGPRIRARNPREATLEVMDQFDSLSTGDIAVIAEQVDIESDERYCLEALDATSQLPAVNTLRALEDSWGDVLMAEECPGTGRKVMAFCRQRFLARADELIGPLAQKVESMRNDKARAKAIEKLSIEIGDRLHDIDHNGSLEKRWDRRLEKSVKARRNVSA